MAGIFLLPFILVWLILFATRLLQAFMWSYLSNYDFFHLSLTWEAFFLFQSWQIVFLATISWSTSFQDFLTFNISVEKSDVTLISLPLQLTWSFTTAASVWFLSSVHWYSKHNVSEGSALVLSIWCFKCFLYLDHHLLRFLKDFLLFYWKDFLFL